MSISQFKTQASLKNHFRKIINRIGVCDSVKTTHPGDFLDFCEVFKRHSDYPGKFIGFVDIKIKYNVVFGNQLVVYIIKNNMTVDNVSVLKNCITGKPKDKLRAKTKLYYLKVAMRVSIQPQIEEYRRNNRRFKVCEICNLHGHGGDHDRIYIDHHSEISPFAKLYNDFLEINTFPIPASFDDTNSHMKCFKDLDYNFEKNWVQYHKENAILRMLCRRCNESQPKYKK